VDDDRQRLVVALVQKKVAELLGSERFNRSFQIGMLASFESFLETTRLKRGDDDDSISNFYDTEKEQADDLTSGRESTLTTSTDSRTATGGRSVTRCPIRRWTLSWMACPARGREVKRP